MQQIVVGEETDHPGPFERRQRLLHRASDRVVIRQDPRRVAGAQDAMRQRLGVIGEGADDERGRSRT